MRRTRGRARGTWLLVESVCAAVCAATSVGCVEQTRIEGSLRGEFVHVLELRRDVSYRKAVVTWFAKGTVYGGEAEATVQLGAGPVVPVTGDLEGEHLRLGAEVSGFWGKRKQWALGVSFGAASYGHQRFAYDVGGIPGLEEVSGWGVPALLLLPGLSLRARLGHDVLLRAEWHGTLAADAIDVRETAFLAEARLTPGASVVAGWRRVNTCAWEAPERNVKFEITGPTAGVVIAF